MLKEAEYTPERGARNGNYSSEVLKKMPKASAHNEVN